MSKQRKTRQRIPNNTRRAIILSLEAGVAYTEISKLYNVSYGAVRDIQAKFKAYQINNEGKDIEKKNGTKNRGSLAVYSQVKKELTDMYEDISRRAGLEITDDKLKKSSAAQLIIISSTALDKGLLLRGEPTSITSNTDKLSTRELLKEFRKKVVGKDKDTEIILEQDGAFNKIKTIPAETVKHKDGGSNV